MNLNLKIRLKEVALVFFLTVLFPSFGLAGNTLEKYFAETQIRINVKNQSLKEVFKSLSEQSGLKFLYDEATLNGINPISVNVSNQNLKDVLDEISRKTGLQFKQTDNTIAVSLPALKVDNLQQQPSKTRKITGKVLDETGEVLPGASVTIKGTGIGAATDIEGNFFLEISENAKLEVAYLGYLTQEVQVGSQTSITVKLKEDSKVLEEVVVIGYGTAKRKDLTGAVGRINASDIQNKPTNNVMDFLRGTVAGFNSNMTTSAKGGGSMEIRGAKSITANAAPLVVVDGIIYNGDIADINPADIESMDILKDGSSAAVYGTRAAAGVLAITTKRGVSEKPTITFNASWGASQLAKTQEIYSPGEYITMKGDARRSMAGFTKPDYYYRDPNNLPQGVTLDMWRDGQTGDPMQVWLKGRLQMTDIEIQNYNDGRTTDWMDEVFQTGLKQDYNVGIAGKSQMSNYYFSLGYQDNEGIIVGDTYRNVRGRLNLTMDIAKWLQIGVNSQFADRDQSTNPVSWGSAVVLSPYGSKYNEDGTLKWFPHDDNLASNPYNNSAADLLDKNTNIIANLFANITLPYGIKYQVIYNNRYAFSKTYQFYSTDTYEGRKTATSSGDLLGGKASRNDGSTYSWQIDNILTWGKTFAKAHKVDLTLLANAEKTQTWDAYVNASQFSPSDALGYHNLDAGLPSNLNVKPKDSNSQTDGKDTYATGTALMGRINYTLMDKYLLTASYRRDGYSAFGGSNPYANFPALALAWRLSEERFMDWSEGWLDFMKLRLSWGINGNRSIGAYAALAQVANGKAIIDGKSMVRIWSNTLANADLRWEKTTANNIGLDFSIFRQVLSGSIEAYTTSTKDLLLTRALPKITAYTSVMSNLGELTNRGMEITLNSNNIRNSNFAWSSALTFSFNRNEVKHLYGTTQNILDDNGKVIGQREADDTSAGWYIGHALDQIYGYKVLGVWQESEKDEAAKYGLKPGDTKLQDVRNFEGRAPGVRSDEDRVFQGYTKPLYRFGLKNDFNLFKCIDISFFLRSDLGHYGSNNTYRHQQLPDYYERLNAYKYEYWTPENPSTVAPRLNGNASPNYTYYKLKSFLRLQDLSVAYTLPKSILSKVQVQNARVFLNMNNLFTVTDWDYWDPETSAPTPRVCTLGISLTL